MRNCSGCDQPLVEPLCDLGSTPLANSYCEAESPPLPTYPLCPYVCGNCFLVQLRETVPPEHLFSDYAYLSSFSDSWLAHAKTFAKMATDRFSLSLKSQVIEIASNDGYLLQYFKELGVPVLGVEPAANAAEVAQKKGIPTEVLFFDSETAKQLPQADLIVGNNVLAHVPDLQDFIAGLKLLLKPEGVISLEFPHLLQMMRQNQFDTIYHEHVYYFSLLALQPIFERHALTVFDLEHLPTHGGSLRLLVKHSSDESKPTTSAVEQEAGLDNLDTYRQFNRQVEKVRDDLLALLTKAKQEGKTVAGYGAPAKGNTLLNFCGIGPGYLPFTVDRSPLKQGLLLPGSRIPVRPVEAIAEERPDYLLILPWNLKDEIMTQMAFIAEWGGKFIVPIPTPTVID